MDNTVLPYTVETDSSDESDSSDSSHEGNLLSNNLGVYNNKFETKNVRFMNMEKVDDYHNLQKDLFHPKISKIRILIDSKNISYSENRNTSNYNLYFDGDNKTNETSGFNSYNNVIGFKFIKAILPTSLHQVNDNNKSFNYRLNSDPNTDIPITLDKGSYTFEELGNHLQNKLGTSFTVDSNTTTYKYEITHTSTSFRIMWNSSNGYSYRLFGFNNKDTEFTLSDTSDNIVQHNVHFVDLVIPEIPHITCKKNSTGKNVIERIPLGASGQIIEYTNDTNLDNYFYPIKLSKINIQLYEDTTDLFYDCQNADNSFEFELTILNY